jgi:hypothetical protein
MGFVKVRFVAVLCTFPENQTGLFATNIAVLCTFSGNGCDCWAGAAHHNICRNWLPVFVRGAAHRNKQSNRISGFDRFCQGEIYCGVLHLFWKRV